MIIIAFCVAACLFPETMPGECSFIISHTRLRFTVILEEPRGVAAVKSL